MNSPWGTVDAQYELGDGAGYWVGTPGHGGLMVRRMWAEQNLSAAALKKGEWWVRWYCFEEDCDWAIVAYERPDIIPTWTNETPDEIKTKALKNLSVYNRDYLLAYGKEKQQLRLLESI